MLDGCEGRDDRAGFERGQEHPVGVLVGPGCLGPSGYRRHREIVTRPLPDHLQDRPQDRDLAGTDLQGDGAVPVGLDVAPARRLCLPWGRAASLASWHRRAVGRRFFDLEAVDSSERKLSSSVGNHLAADDLADPRVMQAGLLANGSKRHTRLLRALEGVAAGLAGLAGLAPRSRLRPWADFLAIFLLRGRLHRRQLDAHAASHPLPPARAPRSRRPTVRGSVTRTGRFRPAGSAASSGATFSSKKSGPTPIAAAASGGVRAILGIDTASFLAMSPAFTRFTPEPSHAPKTVLPADSTPGRPPAPPPLPDLRLALPFAPHPSRLPPPQRLRFTPRLPAPAADHGHSHRVCAWSAGAAGVIWLWEAKALRTKNPQFCP